MWVLTLSVQPACAAFSLFESQPAVTTDACCSEEAPAQQQAPDSPKDCHGCNPFHSCSCCVAAIVLPVSFKMQPLPALPYAAAHGSYHTPRLPQVAFDFWQPPRIS